MDPNACLDRFLEALALRDFREASDARRDLAEWLVKGGFAPAWTPEQKEAYDTFTTLPAYTSVGSYPLLYVFLGEGLCHCCATSVGCQPEDADVHWEGDAYECDQCGEPVESAYGSTEIADERTDEDLRESTE